MSEDLERLERRVHKLERSMRAIFWLLLMGMLLVVLNAMLGMR
jgi:hypothetical protein